jgi:hypothetical protein
MTGVLIGPKFFMSIHERNYVDRNIYTIMENDSFHPVHFWNYKIPFLHEEKERVKLLMNNSYTVHLWRKMWENDNFRAEIENDTFVSEFIIRFISDLLKTN